MAPSRYIFLLALLSCSFGCGGPQLPPSAPGNPSAGYEEAEVVQATRQFVVDPEDPARAVLDHVQQAFLIAHDIEDASDRALLLAEIAVVQAKAGDNAGAANTFDQALQVANWSAAQELPLAKAAAQLGVADGLLQSGKASDASQD